MIYLKVKNQGWRLQWGLGQEGGNPSCFLPAKTIRWPTSYLSHAQLAQTISWLWSAYFTYLTRSLGKPFLMTSIFQLLKQEQITLLQSHFSIVDAWFHIYFVTYLVTYIYAQRLWRRNKLCQKCTSIVGPCQTQMCICHDTFMHNS